MQTSGASVIDTQQFFVDNSCSVCFVHACACACAGACACVRDTKSEINNYVRVRVRVRVHARACVRALYQVQNK